jgi:hypothetical protein
MTLFLHDNLVDTATLSTDNEDANFPHKNIKNPFRTKISKTDSSLATIGADKVTNGGFGSDTSSWTAANSASLASIAGGQSGNCLQITEDGEANPAAYQDITVTPGKLYYVYGYVKEGTEASYRFYAKDGNDNFAGFKTVLEATSSWVLKGFYMFAQTSTITIYLMQVCEAAAGTTLLFDTIKMKEATTGNIVFDFGSAKESQVLAIANHNWTTAPGLLNLEFNTADSWSSPTTTVKISSGGSDTRYFAIRPSTYGNETISLRTFSTVSFRYARLVFASATGTTDSTGIAGLPTQLGRVYIGPYFEPTNDRFQDGDSQEMLDPSILSASADGQEHVDELTKFRSRKFSFFVQTEAQFQKFQKMWTDVGNGKDIFVRFSTDLPDYTMYGKFVKAPRISLQPPSYYKIGLQFKESR